MGGEMLEASHVLKRELTVRLFKKTIDEPLPHAQERERILKMVPEEFERHLEGSVRELLAACVEEMCVAVIREGSESHLLYDETVILDEMLLEFTATADRCMEAVVTDDIDLWFECLDIHIPGTVRQQQEFGDLQERFTQGLKQAVEPESVSSLCKAVTGVLELQAKITSRGKELVQLQEEQGVGLYGHSENPQFLVPLPVTPQGDAAMELDAAAAAERGDGDGDA